MLRAGGTFEDELRRRWWCADGDLETDDDDDDEEETRTGLRDARSTD